jgi:hypothetical protein
LPNPFNPFGPTDPQQFAGRSAEIAALEGRLKSTIDGVPQHTAIMGERGIGKTSLLRKFEEIARSQSCIIARVDLYPGIRDVDHLLVHLHEELRKSCVAFYGSLGKRFETVIDFLENYSVTLPVIGGGIERTRQMSLETSFRDRLLTIWSKVSGKAPAIVIMMDEAEKLAQIEGALEYLRNTFSRLGEQHALYCIVICGKTGLFQTVTELFSPLERFFQPLSLVPLTGAEVIEVLDKATALGGISFDDRTKQEIALESEGQPYVVQVFGYCAHDEASRTRTRRISNDILQNAKPKIHAMLESQLFNRRAIEGVGRSKHKLKILRKLAQSRKDLFSFTEIMKLTGVGKKQGLGSYLTELVNAGCLRKDPSNGSYSFFIKLFKRYAAEKLQAEVG